MFLTYSIRWNLVETQACTNIKYPLFQDQTFLFEFIHHLFLIILSKLIIFLIIPVYFNTLDRGR